MFFENVSKSFLLIFIIPFLLGFDNVYYWWFLGGVLIFDVLIGVIKYSLDKNKLIFQRPHGAFACNVLCLPSNDEGKPGFPSGHVASTTMMMVILIRYFQSSVFTLLASTYISLMALSRYNKKCHNLTQIIWGMLFGLVGATVFIQLTPKEIWT